jgi:hypothetical protein
LFCDGFDQPTNCQGQSINGGNDLVHVTVPTGSYLIIGKAWVGNDDTSDEGEFCELRQGSGASASDLDRTDTFVAGHGFTSTERPYAAVPLVAAATFTDPTTTITLRCSGSDSYADQAVITATKVGQLH